MEGEIQIKSLNKHHKIIMKILIVLTLLVSLVAPAISVLQDAKGRLIGIGESSTAAILRSRGFIAQDYQVNVQDGKYTLSLVRALNPLINNGKAGLPDKEPLLFIHGIILNANCFIYQNENVEPKNYSQHDISSMSIEQLEELLKDDPSSQSLVFTALNFGYEVWLLNRRSTLDSRNAHLFSQTKGIFDVGADLINPPDIIFGDSNYFWNFTYDEQALFDIPETIKRVLRESGRQSLSVISHSAGSALTLMTLTNYPELAANITKAQLWGPVLDYKGGMFTPFVDSILIASLPLISKIMIPFPPQFLVPIVEGVVKFACGSDILRPILCYPVADFLLGKGTSQLMIENLNPQNNWLDPIDLTEEVQLIQALDKTLMHRYDFYDEERNLRTYNQTKPPVYDITRIMSNSLSFWYGNTDSLARSINYGLTNSRLNVSTVRHIIGGSDGIIFNHLGYQLHKNISKLLIIPSLKALVS